LSPGIVRVPRSIGRRRPRYIAVIASVDAVTTVVPVVVAAVPRPRHNEPEAVVQDVRRVGTEPRPPPRLAGRQWRIPDILATMFHALPPSRRYPVALAWRTRM